MNKLLKAAVIASTALAVSAGCATPTFASDSHTSRHIVSAGCIYEDGSGQRSCVWDAKRAGNGSGASFVSLYGGSAYAYIRTPRTAVSKRSPLVVTIKGDGSVTVVHGRTVLARNAHLLAD